MKKFEDFTAKERQEYYSSFKSCPDIDIENKDAIEINGYSLWVHRDGRASSVKARIYLTPWQWKQLLKAMIEDEIEIKDWSCVDLSWLVVD